MKHLSQKIFGKDGSEAGTVTLPSEVFGRTPNARAVSHVAVMLQNNARRSIAHTKDRSEKRGGGRKPWRQKGTGRARHGSIRSPIWRGGGVTHGPRTDRTYGAKINKKQRTSALAMALSAKAQEGTIRVVESLEVPDKKTKTLASHIVAVVGESGKSVLLVSEERNEGLLRAGGNIPRVTITSARSLSLLHVLGATYVIFEKGAIETLTKRIAA